MILHICILDKFIPPFIDFINEHFSEDKHQFLIIGKNNEKYGILDQKNIYYLDKKIKFFVLIKYLYQANRIIIHGLWSKSVLKIFFVQPWLLKKCYWVMWGGDFYFPEKILLDKKYFSI